MRRRFVEGILLLMVATLPPSLSAQSIEGRIDGILAGPRAIHAGVGFTVPVGTYVRSGLVGGVGASEVGVSGRVDLFARFHLDPFREHRWALYAGGGLTARYDDNRRTRHFLFAGVDGPARGGISPSIEAGLGGGGRIGVIIRRSAAERR